MENIADVPINVYFRTDKMIIHFKQNKEHTDYLQFRWCARALLRLTYGEN